MLSRSRSHLADQVLLRTLADVVTKDRATTAELLTLIAEVDRRGLYRGEGYPSMYRYCVGRLRMSEDVACKRILTARASRRFPAILPAVADGRLTVSTVALMSRHLKTPAGEALLAAALGRTRAEVEELIAAQFPKPDVPTTVVLIDPPATTAPPTSGKTDGFPLDMSSEPKALVPGSAEAQSAPGRMDAPLGAQATTLAEQPMPQRRAAPLSPGRYELRLTISQAFHDKLKHAQDLLAHAVPSGDYAELLERALDELIAKQEKLKFAATDRPRVARRSSNPRHIPSRVKRAVWERDQGRCTYKGPDGHRCEARKFLEYDHEKPLARGGQTSVANLRLRCRAHNQLEAERVFGARFMEEKRQGSRAAAGPTP